MSNVYNVFVYLNKNRKYMQITCLFDIQIWLNTLENVYYRYRNKKLLIKNVIKANGYFY